MATLTLGSVLPDCRIASFTMTSCPPTGSQQISFARLLQLLQDRRVKRITMLADGKVAIVEVSHWLSFPSRLGSYRQQ